MYRLALLFLSVMICFMQFAFGANIRQIQTYPSKEQLDVLLFLDNAFNGDIGTATIQDKKLTMISNTQIARNWNKIFSDSPINRLEIIPRNNNIYLSVESKKKYLLKPSLSKDKGTIKLSFYLADDTSSIAHSTQYIQNQNPITQNNFSQHNISTQSPQTASTYPPQYPQQNNQSSWFDSLKFNAANEYIYYIIGLVVLIAGLFALRYQLNKPSTLNGRIRIAMQSPIDARNRIVVFETKDYFYMVLIGEKNNVLMDKISRYKEAKIESKTSSTIGADGAFGEEFWNTLKTKQPPIIK